MLTDNINIDLVYQLGFVLILLAFSLIFFVILVRYLGWLKIHLDRVNELYKIDKNAVKSSIYSLTIIAKSKGMEMLDDEDNNRGKDLPRGKYREFTEI